MNNWSEKVSFIWSVADLLRGPYRPNQYKDIMLPLTVLRRLDCVLEPTKDAVRARYESLEKSKIKNIEPILNREAGQAFHNASRFTFERLKDDPDNIAANLTHYINNFSSKAREIIEYFGFEEHIPKLDGANRLYLLVSRFNDIDLHPDTVSNIEMGYIFEELIRRFNEASNEEAGDHFTPREVIRLMVNLLFAPDDEILTTKGIVKTLFDPAAGTGGMLSVSEKYLRDLNPDARFEVFAQDYNDQAFAICGSDMMIKGNNLDNIRFGDSFTEDQFSSHKFDYMLANPPFGVEWKPEEDFIKKEHENQGWGGRFGAGLPRINDGSLLFLQHMLSKMKTQNEGGTRLGIVFNASPLFTGSAGSGESEIRRWIIENDWLESIVALPSELFYNTGINTYIWILTNRKDPLRKGKVQLIDATEHYKKLRRNLGNKRNEISEEQIKEITRIYGEYREGKYVKILDIGDLGYYRIKVERPLRLNFAVLDERIEKVKEKRQFINLSQSRKSKDLKEIKEEINKGVELQEEIINALNSLRPFGKFKNEKDFSAKLRNALKFSGLNIKTSLLRDIKDALGEKDETAEICTDRKGNPLPDPDLRDYENVPLTENIEEYLKREVFPYVPDAWLDTEYTRIGYDINFNRYFYKYTPSRPLELIEAELKKIEDEITKLLEGLNQ
ncbi:MAG: type I restriction-modification system subunit M [Candidatus Bathyarchaeota archaeon]|nr:type I restriction-modification system subunit M [Candidatus Bathyarchaeota archaeon]